MGFDVTAVNAIFFVALLTAGSAWMGAQWKGSEANQELQREKAERHAEVAHTNISITSAVYSPGPTRFTVNIYNNGSTVVDVSDLTFLVNGRVITASSIESVGVVGATTSDIWLPRETLEAKFVPVSPSPTRFKVVTAAGAAGYWG